MPATRPVIPSAHHPLEQWKNEGGGHKGTAGGRTQGEPGGGFGFRFCGILQQPWEDPVCAPGATWQPALGELCG